MFKEFLKEQLAAASNESRFLLVGEDHTHSGALIALAHCLDEIEKSKVRVIIVAEILKRQHEKRMFFFQTEKPYTVQDIINVVKPRAKDRDALQALIEKKVTVYGLENEHTAPILFLTGNSKQELLESAMKLMPYLFKNNEDVNYLQEFRHVVDDPYADIDTLKMLLEKCFVYSPYRIINANSALVTQLSTLQKLYPSNTLIISAGGTAHIPQAREKINPMKVVHEGVLSSLQKEFGAEKVAACFVHSSISTYQSYVPSDEVLSFAPVTKCFQAPDYFSLPGTEYDKMVNPLRSYLRNEF